MNQLVDEFSTTYEFCRVQRSSNTRKSIVALGVATGALTGVAGLAVYGLLAGKGVAAVLIAKTVASGVGVGWSKLMIPASTGAIGGGVSSLGVTRKSLNHQAQTISEEYEAKNNELHAQLTELEASLAAEQAKVKKSEVGQLESIKGIGPKFAQLLQSAGIHTVEELARADYDELNDLLESSSGGQLVKLDSWISQAQVLTNQNLFHQV